MFETNDVIKAVGSFGNFVGKVAGSYAYQKVRYSKPVDKKVTEIENEIALELNKIKAKRGMSDDAESEEEDVCSVTQSQ